ncbi:hypothetical protein APS67_001839 [Streptomyces sp. AVP053U2]|nr:hypothetical protein APS67_001839 [Streptomyces sp. AVP053U2]
MLQVVVSRSLRASSSLRVRIHLAGLMPVVPWKRREKLRVLKLIVHHAQEGTRTADALRLLGSLAASTHPEPRDDASRRAT